MFIPLDVSEACVTQMHVGRESGSALSGQDNNTLAFVDALWQSIDLWDFP